MSTVEQLALEFEHLPALSCEDFLGTSGNAEAVAWIDRWPDWPSPALAIFGPAGCGKSHLVEVFKALAGATAVTATDLESKLSPLAGALVFEDADAAARAPVRLSDTSAGRVAHGVRDASARDVL